MDNKNFDFYKGKKVLVTGHTGFKGTWLTRMLLNAGANVVGYALKPPTDPNLFTVAGILPADKMDLELSCENVSVSNGTFTSIIGDIRDLDYLMEVFERVKPEIVFHLAAQPIVRDSYKDPVYTYETNVMGTVNICECVRKSPGMGYEGVKSFLNVTTDKVYKNNEWEYGYRENEPLDGYDPYSNSKSCSELVTHSYINSFFNDLHIAVSTARAGNVIGGGDFANDRIIPDCVRAVMAGQDIVVRNPNSTRPYQHVLEPLYVYMTIAMKQYQDASYAGFYNVGPDDKDCVTTGQIVDLFVNKWGEDANWISQNDGGPHEANFLKLDCSKIKSVFGWHPHFNVEEAVAETVAWTKVYMDRGNVANEMDREIAEFLKR